MKTQQLTWSTIENQGLPKKMNERRSVKCLIKTHESGIGYQVGFRNIDHEDWSVIGDTLFDHQIIEYAELDD